MKKAILGLLAETPIHPGTGQNFGVIDLPVAREVSTDYPVIVGSSMKGAMRDKSRQIEECVRKEESESIKRLFGSQEAAGRVSITDARLALLPVRSLTSHYKWVTCPYILERLQRDLIRMGFNLDIPVLKVEGETALVHQGTGSLFLEEICFEMREEPELIKVAQVLKLLISHESLKNRLLGQLTVVSDNEFRYFAKHGLAINARNVLDDGKKSKNLWYEEALPPDTIFYTMLLSQDNEDLDKIKNIFTREPYLQAGGNETIGYGWFNVAWQEPIGR